MREEDNINKILAIFLIIVFFGTISLNATASFIDINENKPVSMKIGTFNGEIFTESEIIGYISGTYAFFPIIKDGFAITRFKGQWEITLGEYAGTRGTVSVIGGKFFQIGWVTIDGSKEKFSMMSQISFNEINKRFSGDLKLILGPTLYTSGDYQ